MTLLRFIPETTNVDLVKYRYLGFAIDALLLRAAIVSILWQAFKLGVDFTGGALVKAAQTIDIGLLHSVRAQALWPKNGFAQK